MSIPRGDSGNPSGVPAGNSGSFEELLGVLNGNNSVSTIPEIDLGGLSSLPDSAGLGGGADYAALGAYLDEQTFGQIAGTNLVIVPQQELEIANIKYGPGMGSLGYGIEGILTATGLKGAKTAGQVIKVVGKEIAEGGLDYVTNGVSSVYGFLKGRFRKPKVAKVDAPAKRATGETVLGRYPEYVKLSDELGARRFEIPPDVWNRMSPAEQWAANKKFLDRTIAHGDKIRLASPIKRATEGTFFRKELDYLYSKGYKLSPDGSTLLPPGP